MSDNLSILFYLNKQKPSGEKYKIYCRIIVNRQKSEFYTGFAIKENSWNDQKRISDVPIINEELAEISSKIYKIRRNLIDCQIPITAAAIIDYYKGNKSPNTYLSVYFAKHVKDIASKAELSRITISQYKTTEKIVNDFLKKQLKKKDLLLTELNYHYLQELDTYMLRDYKDPCNRNIERNTINKHHSRLRTVLNKALNEDLLTRNPYQKFILKNKKTNRDYLSNEELTKIEELDLKEKPALDRVRDFFLFSCFTGLRFNDAFNLKIDDIIDDDGGIKYISIEMHKTEEVVQIPLIEEAQNIIKKYNDHPDREVLGFILPRISNQKLNSHLKVLSYYIETNKTVTHHVARHTFATTALNRGIPLEVVQKLLGHTNIQTTQIYAKMLTSTIVKEMEKMGRVR